MTSRLPLNDCDDQAFQKWIGSIRQACGAFDAEPLGKHFSGGSVEQLGDPTLHMTLVGADHSRLLRSRQHVSQLDERRFFAVLQMRGQGEFEQGEQRATLAPGDLTLLDGARPFSVNLIDRARQVSLILPAASVERNLRSGRVACAQRIAGTSALGMVAGRLILGASRQSHDGMEPQESEAVLDALLTLLKPAIGLPEVAEAGHERMFRRACDFIDAHLADEALAPEWIARSIGVSVRGLYRLFSRQGLVVAQYIKHRRLDACAEALRAGDGCEKLAALAYSWGFADASHFSAAFKTRFGETPGAYRRRYAAVLLAA